MEKELKKEIALLKTRVTRLTKKADNAIIALREYKESQLDSEILALTNTQLQTRVDFLEKKEAEALDMLETSNKSLIFVENQNEDFRKQMSKAADVIKELQVYKDINEKLAQRSDAFDEEKLVHHNKKVGWSVFFLVVAFIELTIACYLNHWI